MPKHPQEAKETCPHDYRDHKRNGCGARARAEPKPGTSPPAADAAD